MINYRTNKAEARTGRKSKIPPAYRIWEWGSNDSEPQTPKPIRQEIDVNDPLPASIPVYYDLKSKTYWIPTATGFTNIGKEDTKSYLCSVCHQHKDNVSTRLTQIQLQRSLDYIGSLPGWPMGPAQVKERWILITNSFTLIQPVEGDWSFIRAILEKRLGNDAIHFYVWLKLSYEALRDGRLEPGLYLIFVGSTGMYKTFTQELIIPPILGGRPAAHPYQFFTGGTDSIMT